MRPIPQLHTAGDERSRSKNHAFCSPPKVDCGSAFLRGLGTSWRSDPGEEMVGILMTQRAWTSPSPTDVCLDFWTSAYQAIDD